jgi:hypothetical protein
MPCHIPHGGNPVRYIEKKHILGILRMIGSRYMPVHFCQTRHKVFPLAVYAFGAIGYFDFPGRANRFYSSIAYKYGMFLKHGFINQCKYIYTGNCIYGYFFGYGYTFCLLITGQDSGSGYTRCCKYTKQPEYWIGGFFGNWHFFILILWLCVLVVPYTGPGFRE